MKFQGLHAAVTVRMIAKREESPKALPSTKSGEPTPRRAFLFVLVRLI
jgi:hypothetical protein